MRATVAPLTDAAFPQVPWEEFPTHMRWQQGEHVTMIAPTGEGKTTLARELLPLRDFVMVLATKRRDKVLDQFKNDGYVVTKKPPKAWQERVIVYPPFPKDSSQLFAKHRAVFKEALLAAYANGGWTVYADEVRYLCGRLGLADLFELLLLQGRSLGATVVASTQRPRHIPLEFYDQPTHLFFWRDSDAGNMKRIAEIGGTIDRAQIMARLPQLPQYQFIHVNTRQNTVVESKVVL